MTAPALAVWPGRSGDGPIVLSWVIARWETDRPRAFAVAHDQVIVATRGLRAGPVQWFVFDRDTAADRLRAAGIELNIESLTLLAAHPEATVVIAVVPTDERKLTMTGHTRTTRKTTTVEYDEAGNVVREETVVVEEFEQNGDAPESEE